MEFGRFAMACLAVVIIIMAGCASQQAAKPTKEQLLNATGNLGAAGNATGLITSSQQDGISVVTIRAANGTFPHNDYNDPFLFAGLYSDAFIRLNRSQIAWLGDNESIWLTLMRSNGSGVLFNAIYSQDFSGCGNDDATILGKMYAMSSLSNGASFGNDDKWKVVLEKNGGCVKRVIIYMDGYFSDLKDGEQIPLFRNDNTVLLEFGSLATAPQAKVIATKPPPATASGNQAAAPARKANATIGNKTGNVTNWDYGVSYVLNQSPEGDGIRLSFEPALPVFPDGRRLDPRNDSTDYGDWFADNYYSSSEAARITMDIGSGQYVLSGFRKGPNVSRFELSKEAGGGITNIGETFLADGKELQFTDVRASGNNIQAVFSYQEGDQQHTLKADVGETERFGNGAVRVWKVARGSTFGATWLDFSYLSDVMDLADPFNNATITWENPDSWENASVSSIFIPRSSPLFKKLANESD